MDSKPPRRTVSHAAATCVRLWVQRMSGRHPAVLMLTDRTGDPSQDEGTRQLADAGRNGSEVFVLTPRPSPPGAEEVKSPLLGPFYLTELRAELVGETLMGLRIDDVIRTIDYILSRPEVSPGSLTVFAHGHMATVALHAAVLDDRITRLTDSDLRSYRDLVNDPMPNDAPRDVLPGVLRRYDLPELRQALGRRLIVSTVPSP